MSDPTLQQLRVFLVVAEEGNIGRAAERLHMAQPPVTRHIQALERVTGCALLERGARGVSLTKKGEVLRAEASRLLGRWDSIVRSLESAGEEPARILGLGAIESVVLHALPNAIVRLRSEFPAVEWELSEGDTADLVEELLAERLDAIVVRGPIPAGNYQTDLVGSEELVVALPSKHPLKDQSIELSELANEQFVGYRTDPLVHNLSSVMIEACVGAGFLPRIRRRAYGTEPLLGLVAAGDGIAMVSEVVARTSRPGVRFARIIGKPAVSHVYLAQRASIPQDIAQALPLLFKETMQQPTPAPRWMPKTASPEGGVEERAHTAEDVRPRPANEGRRR